MKTIFFRTITAGLLVLLSPLSSHAAPTCGESFESSAPVQIDHRQLSESLVSIIEYGLNHNFITLDFVVQLSHATHAEALQKFAETRNDARTVAFKVAVLKLLEEDDVLKRWDSLLTPLNELVSRNKSKKERQEKAKDKTRQVFNPALSGVGEIAPNDEQRWHLTPNGDIWLASLSNTGISILKVGDPKSAIRIERHGLSHGAWHTTPAGETYFATANRLTGSADQVQVYSVKDWGHHKDFLLPSRADGEVAWHTTAAGQDVFAIMSDSITVNVFDFKSGALILSKKIERPGGPFSMGRLAWSKTADILSVPVPNASVQFFDLNHLEQDLQISWLPQSGQSQFQAYPVLWQSLKGSTFVLLSKPEEMVIYALAHPDQPIRIRPNKGRWTHFELDQSAMRLVIATETRVETFDLKETRNGKVVLGNKTSINNENGALIPDSARLFTDDGVPYLAVAQKDESPSSGSGMPMLGVSTSGGRPDRIIIMNLQTHRLLGQIQLPIDAKFNSMLIKSENSGPPTFYISAGGIIYSAPMWQRSERQ